MGFRHVVGLALSLFHCFVGLPRGEFFNVDHFLEESQTHASTRAEFWVKKILVHRRHEQRRY